jgi:hypothetical protein
MRFTSFFLKLDGADDIDLNPWQSFTSFGPVVPTCLGEFPVFPRYAQVPEFTQGDAVEVSMASRLFRFDKHSMIFG